MIKTWRENDRPKIATSYDEEEVRYDEVCMALFEMEKIKASLLEMEFEPELHIEEGGDDENGSEDESS